MKSEKLIEFIRHPEKIGKEDLGEFRDLLRRYPYFQTVRILYLKALKVLDSTEYQSELKYHAVHITSPKQFFRYLNQAFALNADPIQSTYESKDVEIIKEIETVAEMVMSLDLDMEDSLIDIPEIYAASYHFSDTSSSVDTMKLYSDKKRKKKDDLIEQFILADPGMPKINKTTSDTRDLSNENPYSQDNLFSETLAKIYVKQKLYEKAIATYINLSLKYPEKSVYFANLIDSINNKINDNINQE